MRLLGYYPGLSGSLALSLDDPYNMHGIDLLPGGENKVPDEAWAKMQKGDRTLIIYGVIADLGEIEEEEQEKEAETPKVPASKFASAKK